MGIYMGGFNTRRYTLVHGFCFFKLFFMGPKEIYTCETLHELYFFWAVICWSCWQFLSGGWEVSARHREGWHRSWLHYLVRTWAWGLDNDKLIASVVWLDGNAGRKCRSLFES